METPLQVTFRNIGPSEAIEARIRERAGKLEHHFARIVGCRVVVEELHHHHRKGNHFQVRVDVTVPGAELVATREPDAHHSHADLYVAIRDAFDAMDRQLVEHARQQDRRERS
jgi:ribosomal subunit interface protein